MKLEQKCEGLVGMQWKVEGNPTKYVAAGPSKGITTPAEYIKLKNATSVARHTPDSFPAGTPPLLLKMEGNTTHLTTTDLSARKLLLTLGGENPHLGALWQLGFKETSKQVVPSGVVLYMRKQIIIPKDGEVRIC